MLNRVYDNRFTASRAKVETVYIKIGYFYGPPVQLEMLFNDSSQQTPEQDVSG